MENRTEVTEFILLGLTNVPELQVTLFLVFTFIYFINMAGNLGMLMLILWDSRLHTPMYYFLGNLSLVDIFYSSAVTPTAVAGLLSGKQVISYNVCAAQMFLFATFASTEDLLLAAMAYDRYAAVCKPLHYSTTMTTRACSCLTMACYAGGFLNACIHTGETFRASFCKSNMVHHFFCDVPAVMVLSCSDRNVREMVLVYADSFVIYSALLIILISYMFIFVTIFKMNVGEGYQKAMSTCVSHFTAVSIFYGTLIFMYLQPSSSHSMDTDKIISVFYTMVIPMLNPLVYSVRNKEVKRAFKKAVEKTKHSLGI
ncbi:olfactory receptor 5B3-like [Nannospalax galili]|uniref:olfactory receptor 5B3-like n=1 Tax=Nannospalax galili TaxID=1026970 RepID=UPI0004ED65B0|nr:olfactory receptor 5B3-like [Nannospalax galili]